MAARCFWLYPAMAFLAACGSASSPLPAQNLFVHVGLGMALELPPGWACAPEHAATVCAPSAGAATVVVQSRTHATGRLDVALAAEFAPIASLPNFALTPHTLTIVEGRPALAYHATFDLYDVPRERAGVLFRQHGAVVDLSYNAPRDTWPEALPDFIQLVDSLVLACDTVRDHGAK